MTFTDLAFVLVGVVLAAGAGYMVGRAWAGESLFEGTRLRVSVWAFDEVGAPRSTVRGKVGDLLTCAGCFGTWATFAAWALWDLSTGLAVPAGVAVLAALAAAGVQLYAQHATTNRVERTLLALSERERIEGS